MQVNVLEAKNGLSKLLRMLESGKETSITITRNGKPVAKITPANLPPAISKRIGIAEGRFKAPDDFDAAGEDAAAMFG